MSIRRAAPAIALFFLSPLVAEFLLGDFTLAQLHFLFLLAPAYGGAAVLIREVTRRTGRGWPTMVLLGLAYGLLEEGLETQSLFNPHYLGNSLIEPGYVPVLGIGIPWTVFVLTLHTAWSISVPIALAERGRTTPWLGRPGLTVVSILALLGAVGTFAVSYADGHYLASPAQLAVTGFLVIALVVVALRRPATRRPLPGTAPRPRSVLAVTLLAGATFELGAALPTVPGTLVDVLSIALAAGAILLWSRRSGWSSLHTYAAAAGGLLTYAWHGFLSKPLAATPAPLIPISHVVFALGAVVLLVFGFRSLRPAASAELPADVPAVVG